MRPGASGSPGMTSSSPVKKSPSRTFRYTGKVLMPTDAARPVSCGKRRLPAGTISPPFFTSLPVRRIQSPGVGIFFDLAVLLHHHRIRARRDRRAGEDARRGSRLEFPADGARHDLLLYEKRILVFQI